MSIDAPASPPPTDSSPAPTSRPRWSDVVELLSSMRFAIALLTLICIASVIGTVIKQHEPFPNYVNQFGPFWAVVFDKVGLFSIYSAPWFLTILAFLVISTSLCIARNAPKIVTDWRSYKENIRAQSLNAFKHKAQGTWPFKTSEQALAHVTTALGRQGWTAKAQVRDDGIMVAARRGRSNKLGYIAAHGAVVLICLGGLMDGDVIVRALMTLKGITSFEGTGMIKDIDASHRLPINNPTFRGNMFVKEGDRSNVAVLNQKDGVVLQDLPFDIELKKFHVEFYATGMPKLFASDIVIHDHETGQAIPTTVKVNEPAYHRGVAIYQSSFEDGGSKVKLVGWPLRGGEPLKVNGEIGSSIALKSNLDEPVTLELTELRVYNVENLNAAQSSKVDTRAVDLVKRVESHLGSGANTPTEKVLRNIGPSITYKLRDASGQAREFNNYMVPVELDGQRVFLAGVRENTAENMRFLRIPADETDSMTSWLLLRSALSDVALRDAAVARYVKLVATDSSPEVKEQLTVSARRALALFAGDEAIPNTPGGLPAIAGFLDATVPPQEKQQMSDVLIRIMNGSMFELLNAAREQKNLAPLPTNDTTRQFMTHTILSLSDSLYYPVPMIFELDEFEQVQASVFQLTRSPGKTLVYLGAVLLILGVFAMLYIRERRLWIWISTPSDQASMTYQMAMSSTRDTLDLDREFDELKNHLQHSSP